MARNEVSQAKRKRMAALIKDRQAEVVRVRALALVVCAAEGRRSTFDRRNAIGGYLMARRLLDADRGRLAATVIIKGCTAHYAGAWGEGD